MGDFALTSPVGQNLLDALPDLYEEIYETRVLFNTEGQEIDELTANIGDSFNQAFVDLATWGLANWEEFLGIPIDIAKPYDQRRSVIKAKMRGTGTVTVKLLQSVVSSFEHGTIEVTEQPAIYQITVKFIDTLGLPPNLDDIKSTIDETKPAHLAVVYSFRYLALSEVELMKLEQLEIHQMSDFAPFLDA
ncbi:hypothetical protein PAECIP111891_02194 [Paenibacillus allorhizoplanae]|uniref:DUF2313 domain-containing protein n=1 Tax=Paenibacillus allorhizoplanae TaxID=2905648 RepID=A0ABM9C4F1_9BACL|nr:putative phage tail protein [Paenibacillus allorhizoplanae]CAH1202996.1 hypothetical protein PAECIP111891_02194 [Paenibacillus allorhizoplanae]